MNIWTFFFGFGLVHKWHIQVKIRKAIGISSQSCHWQNKRFQCELMYSWKWFWFMLTSVKACCKKLKWVEGFHKLTSLNHKPLISNITKNVGKEWNLIVEIPMLTCSVKKLFRNIFQTLISLIHEYIKSLVVWKYSRSILKFYRLQPNSCQYRDQTRRRFKI